MFIHLEEQEEDDGGGKNQSGNLMDATYISTIYGCEV